MAEFGHGLTAILAWVIDGVDWPPDIVLLPFRYGCTAMILLAISPRSGTSTTPSCSPLPGCLDASSIMSTTYTSSQPQTLRPLSRCWMALSTSYGASVQFWSWPVTDFDIFSDCQASGIWAWDCVLKEMVLVVPSVLAMLGDNPMQSEIACHVGLAGKLFCRICRVSKGSAAAEEDPDGPEPQMTVDDAASIHSRVDSVSDGASVASSQGGHQGQTGRRKKPETMADMVDRIRRFMSVSPCIWFLIIGLRFIYSMDCERWDSLVHD